MPSPFFVSTLKENESRSRLQKRCFKFVSESGKKKKKRLPLPLISPDSAASTLLHCSFRETAQRVKHTGARGKRLPIIFPPCSVMRSAGRRSSTERGEKSRGKKGRMRPGEGKVILWDWLRSSSRRRPGQQLSPVARAAEEPEKMRVAVESGGISLGAAAFSPFKDKDSIMAEKLF